MSRRNIPPGTRIILAKKLEPMLREMARERQREYHGNQYDRTSVNVDKSPNKETASIQMDKTEYHDKPIDVRTEIASAAKVSTGTLAKFDKVQKERPDLVEKIVSIENEEADINTK